MPNHRSSARPPPALVAALLALGWLAVWALGDGWLLGTRFGHYLDRGEATTALVAFALNGAVYAWLALVATVVTGRVVASALVAAALYLALAVASRLKLANLGEPLLPWDWLSAGQFTQMSAAYTAVDVATGTALAAAAVAVAGALVALWREPPVARWKAAVALAALGAPLYALYFVAEPGRKPLGLLNMTWAQPANLQAHGLLNHLGLNLRPAIVLAPPGYGEEAIRRVCGQEEAARAPAAGRRPHVVVILNEAFTRIDRTLAGLVDFGGEVAPFFASLHPATVAVPTFGGLTANAEFEVLTGTPMALLPTGAVPFQQHVVRAQPNALPRLFARAGYRTLAMHPYDRRFWNRDAAFAHLGFERFLAGEAFGATQGPRYFPDAKLVQPIAEAVERSDRPLFLFVTTMENHGPWFDARYDAIAAPLRSMPGDWTPSARRAMDNYAQGVRHGDAFLRTLVARFAGRDDVIVAMFGDHHPTMVVPDMGTRNLMAARFGDIAQKLPPQAADRAILQTEIAFWPAGVRFAPESQLTLLGPALARRAGVPLDGYWRAVERAGAVHPSIQRRYATTADGGAVPLAQAEAVGPLRLLQYDALFGRQWAARHCGR